MNFYLRLEGLRREREMDEELVHPDLTDIPTYLDSSDLQDEEGILFLLLGGNYIVTNFRRPNTTMEVNMNNEPCS